MIPGNYINFTFMIWAFFFNHYFWIWYSTVNIFGNICVALKLLYFAEIYAVQKNSQIFTVAKKSANYSVMFFANICENICGRKNIRKYLRDFFENICANIRNAKHLRRNLRIYGLFSHLYSSDCHMAKYRSTWPNMAIFCHLDKKRQFYE